MKSLLSGAFWGVLLGGVTIGSVSLLAPQPAGNTPPEAPLTEAPEVALELPETVEELPISAEASEPAEVPDAPEALAAAQSTPLPLTDTTPLEVPEVTAVETALIAPEVTTLPALDEGETDLVLPNPQSVAPQVPESEDDLVVSTESAPQPVPEAEVIVVDDTPEEVSSEIDIPEEDVVVVQTPDVVAEETPPQAPENAEVAPEPPAETEVAEAPQPEAEAAPVIVATPEEAPVTPAEPVTGSIIENNRASAMPTGTAGVVVNRVRGGQEPEEEATETVTEVDPDAPAIERYAAAFENADSKPIMSVVMLDDGSLHEAATALGQLPFPITVVLDPTADGATAALEAYRAAGIEVAVQAKIPAGARPVDVEVALEAAFGALPETVVMVDTGEGEMLRDRDVMAQAVAALAEDGRGLLTVSQGLNTGVRAATEAGVPAGLIYRDLDADGQDARVIRRFLDQAAFRARQQEGVILLARLRPETLTALMQWGEANRAGQVAMAPISAMLTAE